MLATCFNVGTQVLKGPKANTGEGCTQQEAIQNARNLIGQGSCGDIRCQGECQGSKTCKKSVVNRVGIVEQCTPAQVLGCPNAKGFSCTVTAPNAQTTFDCVCRCY